MISSVHIRTTVSSAFPDAGPTTRSFDYQPRNELLCESLGRRTNRAGARIREAGSRVAHSDGGTSSRSLRSLLKAQSVPAALWSRGRNSVFAAELLRLGSSIDNIGDCVEDRYYYVLRSFSFPPFEEMERNVRGALLPVQVHSRRLKVVSAAAPSDASSRSSRNRLVALSGTFRKPCATANPPGVSSRRPP